MRAYARARGEDEELWGVVGLLHDMDYERHPDLDTGHPRVALAELEKMDVDPVVIRAIASHADFLGVSRDSPMEKTLYAVDELSGFLLACAYVRPEGIVGLTPKSVKKKLKQPSFAAAVNRDEVRHGAEELGVEFDEHVRVRHRRARGARRRARRARLRARREMSARGRYARILRTPHVAAAAGSPRSSRGCRSASTRSRSSCSCASGRARTRRPGSCRPRSPSAAARAPPLSGRLIDRFGHRRVLVPLALVHGGGLVLLVGLALLDAPVALLLPVGARRRRGDPADLGDDAAAVGRRCSTTTPSCSPPRTRSTRSSSSSSSRSGRCSPRSPRRCCRRRRRSCLAAVLVVGGTLAFTASPPVARVAARPGARAATAGSARCSSPGLRTLVARDAAARLLLRRDGGDAAGLQRGHGHARVGGRAAGGVVARQRGRRPRLRRAGRPPAAGADVRPARRPPAADVRAARRVAVARGDGAAVRPGRRRDRAAGGERQPARRRRRAGRRADRGLHVARHRDRRRASRSATRSPACSSRRPTGASSFLVGAACGALGSALAFARGRGDARRRPARRRPTCAQRQRPPALAHSSRCSTPQNASAIRCSPRWRTSSTRRSPSGPPQCAQRPSPSPGSPGGEDAARLPVRALDHPRDDVLEAAEGGHALALGLGGAEALVAADVDAAPAALRAARHRTRSLAMAPEDPALSCAAMADPLRITVLEGDQTGQELLEQALRVLDPEVLGLELDLERFDLSLETRRATSQRDRPRGRARDARAAGFGLKAATITPEGARRRRLAQPHPPRGGRRQGHHPHRPADPRRHAGRRRPPPDLGRAHGGRRRLRRQAVARGRRGRAGRDRLPDREDHAAATCRAVAEYAFRTARADGRRASTAGRSGRSRPCTRGCSRRSSTPPPSATPTSTTSRS